MRFISRCFGEAIALVGKHGELDPTIVFIATTPRAFHGGHAADFPVGQWVVALEYLKRSCAEIGGNGSSGILKSPAIPQAFL